jgi:hypothetical protein
MCYGAFSLYEWKVSFFPSVSYDCNTPLNNTGRFRGMSFYSSQSPETLLLSLNHELALRIS